MNKLPLFFYFLLLSLNGYSQIGFQFYGKNNKNQCIKFKLINNLIIIPLEINGTKLQFILDTGVNKTILFNLSDRDSIGLKNVKRLQLQGLGSGKPIDALISKGNFFQLKNMKSHNQNLYVILDDKIDLSAKMGTTIHGIIGYELLKNVVAKINYKNKTINFYNPKLYKYKKCRKCEVFPLQFYKNKPFINSKVQVDTLGTQKIDVKLLIDSGGSDAMWLFENSKPEIQTPKKHFASILGEGLSGTIYGNRSKIPKAFLGKFTIENPTVSFLDSASTLNARRFRQRNGSIGGNILKRFNVWIDYPNKKLMLKKVSPLKGFHYNMSGLSILYAGKELVKEKDEVSITNPLSKKGSKNSNFSVNFITKIRYLFKPKFKIDKVLKGSPADLAGLQKGDIIKKINGKPANTYTLNKITLLFQQKPNKKIRIEVERNGILLQFQFYLKERI